MKQYTDENGNIIREYSFKDWEAGDIFGDLKPWKERCQNSSTGEIFYQYLPKEEHELIVKKRKSLYQQKVDKRFKYLKADYQKRKDQSVKKERFRQTEIEKCEYLLLSEVRKGRDCPSDFKGIKGGLLLSWANELYPKFVRGEREYQHTNSPNFKFQFGTGDFYHIEVDAFSNYFNWLKELGKTHPAKAPKKAPPLPNPEGYEEIKGEFN